MSANLFRPTALHPFLEELGVKAKKSLSQNFLIDGNILRKIIATAAVQEGDTVLEIGPGPGALTEALLKTGARVIAVEKDRTFAAALQRLQTADQRLTVVEADFLESDLSQFFMQYIPNGIQESVNGNVGASDLQQAMPLAKQPMCKHMVDATSCKGEDAGAASSRFLNPVRYNEQKIKVVANLPYNIATAVIIRLIPLHMHIVTLTLMLQKEVARRLTAMPRCAEYGSLTVYMQYFCRAEYAFTVGPNCFFPRPKVDSAIVHITPMAPIPIAALDDFFQMTRTAFQQRRKMLRASLSKLYDRETITLTLQALGLNAQARPEELSLADFIALFERFCLR